MGADLPMVGRGRARHLFHRLHPVLDSRGGTRRLVLHGRLPGGRRHGRRPPLVLWRRLILAPPVSPPSCTSLRIPRGSFAFGRWILHSSLFTLRSSLFTLPLFFPWERHHVPCGESLAAVGLQCAQALHAHHLPLCLYLPLTMIVPLPVDGVILRRGAPAEVVHTHAHAPHGYAQQALYAKRLRAVIIIVYFFFAFCSAIRAFHCSTS